MRKEGRSGVEVGTDTVIVGYNSNKQTKKLGIGKTYNKHEQKRTYNTITTTHWDAHHTSASTTFMLSKIKITWRTKFGKKLNNNHRNRKKKMRQSKKKPTEMVKSRSDKSRKKTYGNRSGKNDPKFQNL